MTPRAGSSLPSRQRRANGSVSAVLCCLLAVAAIVACDRPSHHGVAHRLIVEPTEEVLDLDALRKSYGYTRQSFKDADQLRRWRTHDAAERVIEGGLLKIRPSGEGLPFIRLAHEIEISAEDVREIVVVARGILRGRLRLSWAIPGEGFVAGRKLMLRAGGAGAVAYRFEVAGHAAWRGKIRALRLDLPNIAGQEIGIRSFETRGRGGYQAEMLAHIVARNWKVELGYEARNAVLTPPDVPRRWRLPEPAAGRLRFAYGLPRVEVPGGARTITFRVLAANGDEQVVLFEDTVDPRDRRRAGRWLEGEVEISGGTGEPREGSADEPPGDTDESRADDTPQRRGEAWSGEVGELVFETSAPPGYRIDAGLPAWANPEILGPVPGDRRPNVILISIDTLRADRLGVYGHGEPTSPNIDRWARSHGVTFRRAVATAPWTLPSHVSMLSGLDALRHGVNHHLPAPRELELLAEMLRREGYRTAAVTGGGWLHPDQGLAQGFDVFHYWGRGAGGANELHAGFTRALQLLEEGRERELFLFFHTYEVHDPFRQRRPWAERCATTSDPTQRANEARPLAPLRADVLYGAVEEPRTTAEGFALRYGFRKWLAGTSAVADGVPITDAELPLVSCLYDSGVAYVDRYLGRLLERLEALDPDRRTLVVLTSDHGESLGENGYVKHAYLIDSNLLVPLIVGLPGGRHGGETVEAQVSSVDLVPTILAAAGVESPAGLDGESLLPLIEGQASAGPRQAWSYAGASNFGLSLRLDDRAKYVYNNTAWTPLGGAEEFYDLRADAEERQDPSAASPRRVEGLRARLVEYLEANAQGVGVEIENRSCGELAGELVGLPVHVSRVKAARPPGERFAWLGKRRGGFRLAPGEQLEVLLEAAHGTVTIEGELGPCPGAGLPTEGKRAFRQLLDLDRLETWELGFDGTAWRERLAGEAARARVVVRRRGRSVNQAPTSEMDPELVERLKALGYLDD